MKKLLSFLVFAALPLFAQGPAYPYSASLTWTLSTSSKIASQNVYRSPFTTTCGTFAKLTTTPLSAAATAYSDLNPPEGSYCYGVTATNTSNAESGLSNIDSNVNIPPPPPTGLNTVVALNTDGDYDVLYQWKNPPSATGNAIYADNQRIVTIAFATDKLKVTSPAGVHQVFVTAIGKTGESGPSHQVKVSVP